MHTAASLCISSHKYVSTWDLAAVCNITSPTPQKPFRTL